MRGTWNEELGMKNNPITLGKQYRICTSNIRTKRKSLSVLCCIVLGPALDMVGAGAGCAASGDGWALGGVCLDGGWSWRWVGAGWAKYKGSDGCWVGKARGK